MIYVGSENRAVPVDPVIPAPVVPGFTVSKMFPQ